MSYPRLPLALCFVLTACESRPAAPTATSTTPTSVLPAFERGAPTHDAAGAAPAVPAVDASTMDDASAAEIAEVAPKGMHLVPAGAFTMGADSGGEQDEHPAHQVTLPAFWLDDTEVTQKAYFTCVDAGACRPPKMAYLESYGGAFRGPQRPIVGVSQADSSAYCTHVGKRLPREAEFEKAVRGTDARRYPWGNEPPTRERAVFNGDVTEDVASHPDGRGPYGHFDLAGNVWEWLADAYDPYAYKRPGAERGEVGSCAEIVEFQNELRRQHKQGYTGTNPIPTECEVAIRGGAYNMPAEALRSSNRVHHPGTFRLQMTGFRCAKDAS